MLAAPRPVTPVIGTGILIITVKLVPRYTRAGLQVTSLLTVAHIIVVTVPVFITQAARYGRKHTSAVRIAGIFRTAIPVFAHQGSTGLAAPIQAGVTRGAGIAIVTGKGVMGVKAP